MACYCGNEPSFEECCQPYLDGDARPDTAEKLMRSRYTAYAVQNIDYVLSTHDPDSVDQVDREGAVKWSETSTWDGLQIVDASQGGLDDDEGVVEFIAQYSNEGRSFSHHERSTFRRVDGDWFYMDGEIVKQKPKVRDKPKVGRNERCPCGSGKKYKKCHGRNQ